MIFDDYVKYTNKYQEIYGKNTLVFIEVGSFFEIYGVHNENETSGANMMEIGSLLNIQVSRKNKSILENSRENPMMAGFPNHALKKFLDILVQNNYTVIIIEQVTPPPNPKREVTQIISPSTYLDNINTPDANTLMIINLDEFQNWKNHSKKTFGLGVSVVDLSTSRTSVSETYGDMSSINEELTRVCLFHNPKELVIFSKNSINEFIHIPSHIFWHNKIGLDENNRFFDNNYRNPVLNKVFANKSGMLNPIEYLNLEKYQLGTIAFVYMLDFIYAHNESLIKNVSKPVIEQEQNTNLILTNNCLSQLDIIGKPGCLCDILNNCITAIGKRYFKRVITNPTTDTNHLIQMYEKTQKFIDNNQYKFVRKRLQNVHDIERIINRTQIHPHNWTTLYASLVEIQNFNDIDISKCISDIEDSFDIVKTSKYNISTIDENIFNEGYNRDLDDLQRNSNDIYSYFKNLHQNISTYIRLENNDKDGLVFVTTSKKFQDLLKCATCPKFFKSFKSTKYKQNHIKVYTEETDNKNNEYLEIRESIRIRVAEEFNNYCKQFIDKYSDEIDSAIKYIENSDFIANNAFNAIHMGLVKPNLQISENYSSSSFIQCKQLRHPIIEHIQNDIKYVPNDITLNPQTRGIILYGINAAGKSSLMKSVGIAVIMAQSGMFVAANECTFYPYNDIHTRILSHDNIYKHQSTFTVEMSELRSILQKSSDKSLVIGDELCSGTESISAISLVTAGITHLSKRNSSFIFATHLHELSNLDEINIALKNVVFKHLSVKFNRENNTIVYDRILKDGSGETLYGLEVCQSLDLDSNFLKTANEIRRKLIHTSDEIVRYKKSHYNSTIYKDECHICKKKAEDIHHIEHQANADENGMINGFHKNRAFNLVPLCKECHDAVHNNEFEIQGFVQTNNGKSIITEYNKKNKNKIAKKLI